MFSFITTLLSALAISIVGAYFSILGLASIFPGSQNSVIIMGIVLEIGKIVTVLWLHRNWSKTRFLIKSYFCFAVVVLMGITSLGIFGFLSKSHIEHQNSANNELALMENLETRISKEKELILKYERNIEDLKNNSSNTENRSDKEIEREESKLNSLSKKLKEDIQIETNRINELNLRRKVLDDEMNKLNSSSGGLFSSKKKKIDLLEQSQKEERSSISKKINSYNANIENFRKSFDKEFEKSSEIIEKYRNKDSSLSGENLGKIDEYDEKIRDSMDSVQSMQIEKNKYGEAIRSLEAEIGPLKYFVGLIKDFSGKDIDSGQAVRFLVLILMAVFDPLAILLVVAAQITYLKMNEDSEKNYSSYGMLLGRVKDLFSFRSNEDASKKNAKIISKAPRIIVAKEQPTRNLEEPIVNKVDENIPENPDPEKNSGAHFL